MRTCDTTTLRNMLIEGERSLRANRDTINALNVFPVPDGDTGNNMCLTLRAATEKAATSTAETCSELLKIIADSSLLDARGNSGVIFSQFLRGVADATEGLDTLDAKALTTAFEKGARTAYETVTSPAEGTMLTVLRAAAETAGQIAEHEVEVQVVMQAFVQQAEETLKETPKLLAVLRDAGVVDAGGLGVVCYARGMALGLAGKRVRFDGSYQEEIEEFVELPKLDPNQELEFGSCLEFFVSGEALSASDLKAQLSQLGDSLMVVGSDGGRVLKVHLHTNEPERALAHGRALGDVSKVKCDDIRDQQRELLEKRKDTNERELALVAVASGTGLEEVLRSLGADVIVNGGQTNNPSVDQIREAIESTGAKSAIVLPNNKNIILAARQLSRLSSRSIHVVESKTIPQGINALLAFDRKANLKRNLVQMNRAVAETHGGHVTFATRDATVQDQIIRKGDFMAFSGERLCSVGDHLITVVSELVAALVDECEGEENVELMTLYSGADVTPEQTEELVRTLEDRYQEAEVEHYEGGQPFYHLIVSVE